MVQHNAQNVLAAFDVLIEEMEDALQNIHKEGADALESRNYERAQTAIEHARRVMLFREKIASLKGEWKDVEEAFSGHEDSGQHTPPAASVQRQTSMHSAPTAPAKPHPVILLKPVYTRAGGELTDPQEGCKLKDIRIKTAGEQPCLGVRQ